MRSWRAVSLQQLSFLFGPTVISRFISHCILYIVSGCPDIAPPPNAWIRRRGDQMVIGCINTEERWHLTCRGNDWMGTYGNCSGGNDISFSIPCKTSIKCRVSNKRRGFLAIQSCQNTSHCHALVTVRHSYSQTLSADTDQKSESEMV